MSTEKITRLETLLFTLCFLFVCTSCAVRTPVRQVSLAEVAQNLKYENIIFKDMSLSSHLKTNVPTQSPVMQCEVTAITYLESKNIFKKVEKERRDGILYEEPTIIVETELTFLRIVSTAARFWAGAMAGRSTMKINVILKDASDGKIIARQELVGAPNAYASAWGMGAARINHYPKKWDIY